MKIRKQINFQISFAIYEKSSLLSFINYFHIMKYNIIMILKKKFFDSIDKIMKDTIIKYNYIKINFNTIEGFIIRLNDF